MADKSLAFSRRAVFSSPLAAPTDLDRTFCSARRVSNALIAVPNALIAVPNAPITVPNAPIAVPKAPIAVF